MSVSTFSRNNRICPDWSNLISDLLFNIFNGLDIVDKRCFGSVCHSWRIFAKDEIKSFLRSSVPKSPFLLRPCIDNQGEVGESACSMLSLDAEFFQPLKMPFRSRIQGSCRSGWLLLKIRKINLVLWNPVLEVKIHLPSIPPFSGFMQSPEKCWVPNWISKAAIFGSDPIISTDCGVVLIHGLGKLAAAKYGDSQWTDLGGAASSRYSDVACSFKNKNMILALSNNGKVELWNFSAPSPEKTMVIEVPFPQDMVESNLTDHYIYTSYIVESQDSILLVVRWIAAIVDRNGVVLTFQEYIEENNPELFHHRTKNFYIYTLDLGAKRWVPVQSLDNLVLFLGRNQSFSLHAEDYAGCQKNSIYFTGDCYSCRVDEHIDMGIFSLEDKSFHEISRFEWGDDISPPLFVFSGSS